MDMTLILEDLIFIVSFILAVTVIFCIFKIVTK